MRRDHLLFNQPRAIYALLKDKPASAYIDTIAYTTQTIEAFCERHPLDVSKRTNDDTIENQTNPPLMASFFYYYIYCYQSLPTQQQFSEFYRALNEKWVKSNLIPTQKEAFESRLARFYASIVREFHFYHLAKESGKFQQVYYTLGQDIENKMDCLVEKEGVKMGIQLRVQTASSKKYAEKKSSRGFSNSGIYLVDVALDLNHAKHVPTKKDAFLFYDETYINRLLEVLQTEESA